MTFKIFGARGCRVYAFRVKGLEGSTGLRGFRGFRVQEGFRADGFGFRGLGCSCLSNTRSRV